MTPEAAWQQALADVLRGRTPSEVATGAELSPETVRRWLRGERVPTATRWRALVLQAGLEDRWAELSAARDAVARKPTGRPRLAKAVRVERLRRQLEEVQNG